MKHIVAAIGLLLLAGCGSSEPAIEYPNRVDPEGDYVQKPSRMVFPMSAAGMTRTGVVEHDAATSDISAGYNLNDPELKMSTMIHVYPLRSTDVPAKAPDVVCADHYAQLKAAIAGTYPDNQLLEETRPPSPSAVHGQRGRRAAYLATANFAGYEQRVKAQLDLYCFVGGRWTIAYMTTAPADFAFDAPLLTLQQAIIWPKPIKG